MTAKPSPKLKVVAAEPLRHLRPATRDWVQLVRETWEIDEARDRLLVMAAETWDRYEQAREILDTQGLTYTDSRENPRSRPEVAVERDSRIAFARLMRELDLDEEPTVPRGPLALGPRRGGGRR